MANLIFPMLNSNNRKRCFSWENNINDWDDFLVDETNYPRLEYSLKEVDQAGKLIAIKNLHPEGTDIPSDVRDAFLIANNWRDAHAFPMRSIRSSIRAALRINNKKGIVAARLKRMQAIREKLIRLNHLKLNTIQDLGGCRVILPHISDISILENILSTTLSSELISKKAYIDQPKDDGYRSHHLIFRYRGKRTHSFDGKKIEVQVRTELQHTWATAVESVSLLRKERLKYSDGDQNWLRLLVLMSAEFAEYENCSPVPNTPNTNERREEIRELANSLDAVNLLEGLSFAVELTDPKQLQKSQASHLLVSYDYETNEVDVKPFYRAIEATKSYDLAESELRSNQQKRVVVVLVEADKIANLKLAYPSYFGDVSLFKNHLKNIAHGDRAKQLHLPPKIPSPKKERELKGDLSWLRGSQRPRPNLKFKPKNKKK